MDKIKTVPGIVESSVELFGDRPCMGTRVGDKYEWITYSEFGRLVQKFRNVLAHHKIEKGDKVALICNNRVEWAVCMYAVTGIGANLVPMYEAQLERDWKYILNDSDAKMCVVSQERIYEKVKSMVGSVGKLESVICMDASDEYSHSFQRWMNQVEGEEPIPMASIEPQDLSVIIYTSGTTGNPKGGAYTRQCGCQLRGPSRYIWKRPGRAHFFGVFALGACIRSNCRTTFSPRFRFGPRYRGKP